MNDTSPAATLRAAAAQMARRAPYGPCLSDKEAEALAALLTEVADSVEEDGGRIENSTDAAALALARQILGDPAPASPAVAAPPADRAAVLREAIDVAREEGHRLEGVAGIEAARGARSVAYLLRRLLAKAQPAEPSRVAAETTQPDTTKEI